jgi:hypothetical protein
VSSIKRAIYGDKANEVPGLLTRQASDEKRITDLESTKKQAIWWGSGLLVGLQGLIYVIYKYLLK